ncbi:MAG: ATP-binding protein [Leptospiraceae bacterium]|nr:ATP-binding protein [Leptospiraceae bacterium]
MLNVKKAKEHLSNFTFKKLFIEELGWSNPRNTQESKITLNKVGSFTKTLLAELSGVAVYEIRSENGLIPNAEERKEIHKEISKLSFENLLIFLDKEETQSLWYWIKREDKKQYVRDHLYVKGQPGDLFLNKLSGMVVDIGDFDSSGNISVLEVANRLKKSLDIEKVTKKFYNEFKDEKSNFIEYIKGIKEERDKHWYASITLNRLMFVYFLQKKGFVDKGRVNYLREKLEESKKEGKDLFYKKFLEYLFFEGFAKEKKDRSKEANAILGEIKYLNGGLFLKHRIEKENEIKIADKAFETLFALFEKYSWHLDDSPGGKDDEINPAVLGYIFEKYINQKEFGAYYTRTEMTDYLAERTIHKALLQKIKEKYPQVKAETLSEVLMKLDDTLALLLVKEILPVFSVLDPACGSGAFLVAAMKILIDIYSAVVGKIKLSKNTELKTWLAIIEKDHPSLLYFIKKKIITDNVYGVDIMEEAVEIARLRLFLTLAASANTLEELEPLPNIDFNILPGNSLIGLIKVDEDRFDEIEKAKPTKEDYRTAVQGNFFKNVPVQKSLFGSSHAASYQKLVKEREILIHDYKYYEELGIKDVGVLRGDIHKKEKDAHAVLDKLLLAEFEHLRIEYEEATWDEKKNEEGKPKKRPVNMADIVSLKPFHWGYSFSEIFRQGGFDCILTNPPWEIFKPNAKEFFLEYSELVTRKKMDIKSFEKEKGKLLEDKDLRKAWLNYLNAFPHVSLFFRNSTNYKNQISIVNDKKAGTDINLYKLFTEQCFNLLKPNGDCGIVIPSGIYTDLGTKQLREMLFSRTNITGLFCFENRKAIFENVDSRFKFVVLTFEKIPMSFDKGTGRDLSLPNTNKSFPASFMRHDVRELESFPNSDSIRIDIDLVRKLSPDSLSVMEFKTEMDIVIAKKMLRYPLLGEEIERTWNLKLVSEFHMTNDSYLFKTKHVEGRLPLYEGKMIWQFDSKYAEPQYWIGEKEGRKAFLGTEKDKGQILEYQYYRLGFRDIASNTNERTIISSIIPPTFHGNKIPTLKVFFEGKHMIQYQEQLYLSAIWNSFVLDYHIRQKVTTTLNFFYIYQLPVPRLSEKSTGQEKKTFDSLVERATKLICTTEEFADLWKEVMGTKWTKNSGVTDDKARAKLRAEIDAIVAHLYGITEEEFIHILSTFPIVKEDVKQLTLEEYRKKG